jgi:hypothetical protein
MASPCQHCHPLIDRLSPDEHLLAGYFSSTAVTIRFRIWGALL